MNIEITGIPELDAKISEIIGKINNDAVQAARDCGENLLEESRDVTPLDTGDLRKTGVVVPIENGCKVGYNTVYALRLHEHPEYKFKTPGTGGKYLENPLKKNINKYIKYVADAIAKGLGK